MTVEVNKPTYEILLRKCNEIRAEIGIDVPDKDLIVTILDALIDKIDEVEI